MNRSVLTKRTPTSPNNPPRAPVKMAPKGQPVPLSLNFMIYGNHIERITGDLHDSKTKVEERTLKFEKIKTLDGNKMRPHSAHVDKHILESMSRSPSVDSSFYNRFERLDRDTVIGDTAFKEKGVQRDRIRSAGSRSRPCSARSRPTSGRLRSNTGRSRPSSGRSRPSSAKERKRERSTSVSSAPRQRQQTTNKQQTDATDGHVTPRTSTGSFFEMAMSFDDETKQNTLNNAVRQISPRTVLGLHNTTNKTKHPESNRATVRPRSGRKTRERSPSCKRRDSTSSVGSRSIGSASLASSRASRADRRHQNKDRSRKSRSRTRHVVTREKDIDKENSSNKSSSAKQKGATRSISSASKRKIKSADISRHRFVVKTINALPVDEIVTSPIREDTGNFAYNYKHTRVHTQKKSSPAKRCAIRHVPEKVGNAPIDAVRKANIIEESESEACDIEKLFCGDSKGISSTLPKLRMIVAPTATPLASLIRTSSAKMLMHNNESKQTSLKENNRVA